jgi:hypothetical protein
MLLAWKVMLATFGDMASLKEEKARQRQAAKLPPIEDTIQVSVKMRSTNFSSESHIIESTGTKIARRYRGGLGRAFNRQSALSSSADKADENSSPSDEVPLDANIVKSPQDEQPVEASIEERRKLV